MVLAQRTTIDYETYFEHALSEPDRLLEFYRGEVREKPGMSRDHNRDQSLLAHLLNRQLDFSEYQVRDNSARLRTPTGEVYIPDVAVVPTAMVDALDGPEESLETYVLPVPFVVELWSPSTGRYDVTTKFTGYRARRDREIRRLHPREKTVTAWRPQADDTYTETTHRGGSLTLWALPQVTIDPDRLLG